MEDHDVCDKCGDADIEAGFIAGHCFGFVPFPKKWLNSTLVKVNARLCKGCGAVTFVADSDSLATYLNK